MIVAVQPCDQAFLADPAKVMNRLYWRCADMIELRLDFAEVSEWPKILESLRLAPCHLIVTCRRVSDGGQFAADEATRLKALRDFAQAGARYIDIESDVENADDFVDPPSALRSFHNMEETNQAELREVIAKLKEQSAFNIKLATKANCLADNLVHRELLKEMQSLWLKASFGIGMRGMPSRLLQPFWGGGLVYGAAGSAEWSQKGRLPWVDDLVRVYRMRHWFANKAKMPALYGLAGTPIEHSLSPQIHNGFFARHKVDAFYIPLESDDADEVAAFAKEFDFKGLSVTIPLKEKIAPAFGGPEGVFNTVKLASSSAFETVAKPPSSVHSEEDAEASGSNHEEKEPTASFANTDIQGFREDLRCLIDDAKLAQTRVLIIGAGGAAYAAVEALKNDAGEVLIMNRTASRAKALAAKTGVGYHPNPYEDEFGFDLIVNATPCGGQGPLRDATPVELGKLTLNERACVYDLVAGESLWREQCRLPSRGGKGMLVKQAILQQKYWGTRPATLAFNDLRLALVGFRGAGKTTLGKVIAETLKLPFIDLDDAIELRTEMSISSFFAKHGEAAFRDIEADTLAKALQAKPNFVLATGGGIVEKPENMRQLSEHSSVIYMASSNETLRQNLSSGGRPSLHPEGIEGEIRDILPRREERYEAIQDVTNQDFSRIPIETIPNLLPYILPFSAALDVRRARNDA